MGSEELAGLGDYLRELLREVRATAAEQYTREELRNVVEELLSEASVQRWMAGQMEKTRVRAYEHANGVTMELVPSYEIAAMWAGVCRGLLQDAPNYSETKFDGEHFEENDKVVMENHLPGSPETFTVTVQRHGPGRLTPHEAREKAESAVDATWEWIGNSSGCDTRDLALTLERLGFPPPPEKEKNG